MTSYRKADTQAQWFQNRYPGAPMDPNVVVLHTTESAGWPGYSGGATAPNATARPDFAHKRLLWRQHFPDDRSARALRNAAGGVETNTLNAVQVELVGTCDPSHRHRWGSLAAGVDYLYWPDAPDWALRGLAEYLADQHKRNGVKLQAPRFLPYPSSYGNSAVRMSGRQWRNFYGVCGHQHVPENTHGDPGDLDIDRVLRMARDIADPPVSDDASPTRVQNAHRVGDRLLRVLFNAIKHGRTGRVREVRNKIRRQLNRLPRK